MGDDDVVVLSLLLLLVDATGSRPCSSCLFLRVEVDDGVEDEEAEGRMRSTVFNQRVGGPQRKGGREWNGIFS